MKKIKMKMSIASVIITAVVIACVIFVNAIIGVFTDSYPLKIDLTKDKIYEFSNQTKDIMKNLDVEVRAYAVLPEGFSYEYTDYIKPYLEKYSSLNKNFKVEYIDPYENTEFLSKYTSTNQQIDIGTIIIESGENHEIIPLSEMYTQSYFEAVESIDMERKITNAIMLVTGKLSEANIYFDINHTTPGLQITEGLEIGACMNAFLSSEGNKCGYVNINTDGIPEDADIIISLMPMVDFTEEEIKALDSFLEGGGRFLVFADNSMSPLKNLDAFLLEWGLKINYDYVIDLESNLSMPDGNGVPVPAAKMSAEHSITEKLAYSALPLALPGTISITTQKSVNGADTDKILLTSEAAYSKGEDATTLEKEAGDATGPLCTAAAAVNWEGETSVVMVVGSVQGFEYLGYIGDGNYLNADFLLNAISYLSGNDYSSDIRAKQITPETMVMSQKQAKNINLILVWVIPGAIILAGLVIWLRRRFK